MIKYIQLGTTQQCFKNGIRGGWEYVIGVQNTNNKLVGTYHYMCQNTKEAKRWSARPNDCTTFRLTIIKEGEIL